MHSLPDNALNPLGLLAEASLANRKQQAASKSGDTPSERVGVASDVYSLRNKSVCNDAARDRFCKAGFFAFGST